MGSRVKTDYYKVVHALSSNHPVSLLLKAAKLSRSGFYKWRCKQAHHQPSNNYDIKQRIESIHAKYPFYGYRRITAVLHRPGIVGNHKRVHRLMKTLGLQSTTCKKCRYFGRKGSAVFPNLLQRNFTSLKSKRKLATDIAKLPVKNSFIYLSAAQALRNNEIVSYKIAKKNSLNLVLETVTAFKGAVSGETISHSDQGFQYTSKDYKQKLQEVGIRGSHSRKGNCLDNACIESFFSHLKTEALTRKITLPEEEMIARVVEYITFYNNERFQKKFGQLSPIEYQEKLAA
ncbi:IS3 family transposase [Halodesulfovibrio sp.]|uniref:IS3 family transposase n=1 Tax=Halodesulfovibrio sp. TaxID=1912772 RepID=UPI0025C321B0|nr:IS3 family transposase [Halodesulfovibrio sp.]